MFDLKKDIEQTLKKYPNLVSDMKSVSGSFIAIDKSSKIEIQEYEILIRFGKEYPYRFPIVEETSKKIPRDLSRHIMPNGTICFGIPQDELALCRNGITLVWFLEEILNPHLCREYTREILGFYFTGERSHGNEGIWEGYYDIFKSVDKRAILNNLEMIHNHSKIGRNIPCYCNSNKKYKFCHEKLEAEIFKVGFNNAIQIFEILKTDYKKQNDTN